MKLSHLSTALFVAGLSLAATTSHAEGFRFMPGMEPGFKAEPTLAISAGIAHAPAANDNAIAIYGLDFSVNCGLFQTPDNRIRTHLQINRVDESGIEATTFELSPRYTMPMGSGFSVGVGPVLAMVKADNGNADKNLFGYGAVAGLNYRNGMLYAGSDLRYMNTNERDQVTFENWALTAKIGINF
jgi:hypothetical protein